MTSSTFTLTLPPDPGFRSTLPPREPQTPALVVVWSLYEPARIGEVLPVPSDGQPRVLGRGQHPGSRFERLEGLRQRPGRLEPTGPLLSPTISREQLLLEAFADRLLIRNLGRCPTLVNEVPLQHAELRPGDLLELQDQLLLLCVMRPAQLPPAPEVGLHPFGESDPLGIVGESPAAWELRAQIAFVAGSNTHVLIRGESGTGKELVARAIHSHSPRAGRKLVSRNAATFPEGLIDAELFGNVKNYPNPGMADRPGLIGEASGSMLFLDEFGELPSEMQAHLLRVLDEGEYQRLGETLIRRADIRLLAATNRPESHLKHDLLARLKLRLEVPDLNSRREDIPLIARFLLRSIALESPQRAGRFMEGGARGEPRIAPALMYHLVRRQYTTHVRELERVLWQSLSASHGNFLEMPEGAMGEQLERPVSEEPAPAIAKAPAPNFSAPLAGTEVAERPGATPEADAAGWEQSLEPQEGQLLELFRRHRFRITESVRDSACPVERATADLYARVLMLKALRHAAWSLPDGALLVAGPDNPWLEPRIRERLETLIENLRERLEEEPAVVRQKLSRYYRAAYPVVEDTLLALRTGKVRA